ncbi:MAG: DUF5615 family PIN-like protein [Candidatus Sumerlaeota bacterium]|nr:DUF5615 family PIN-like protein [Candidatus Sumerlaeota bacterium]
MVRYLADENFNNDILRGLWLRAPSIDIARVQDTGVAGADDPTVLERAADEGRVMLSHDVNTLVGHANKRIAAGRRMPGVFIVPRGTSLAAVIDDLLLLAECSREGEWEGRVLYLPLR